MLIIGTVAVGLTAYADAGGLEVPRVGIALEGTTAMPMLGMPGAAIFGPALELGFHPAVIRSAYAKNYALAIDAAQGRLMLLRNIVSGSLITAPIGSTGSDDLVLNAAEDSAVLISHAASTLQIVTGLPENPEFSAAISFSSVGLPLTAVALDGSGRNILAAFTDGSHGEIDWFDASGSRTFIFAGSQPSAIVYSNADQDAVVADRGSNQVFLIRNLTGSREPVMLASAPDTIAPVALAVWNNTHVLIASQDSKNLVDYDLRQMNVAARYDLPVAPSKLEPLIDPNFLMINEVSPDPTYLFAPAGHPFLYFMPPPQNRTRRLPVRR